MSCSGLDSAAVGYVVVVSLRLASAADLLSHVLLVAACLLEVLHSIRAGHMLGLGAVLAPQKMSQLPA